VRNMNGVKEFNQLNTSFFEVTSNCNRDETFYSENFLLLH
jgi:hypothetical protein